jgi:hypothetical protein
MKEQELSPAVKILVTRMETHPEEFFDEGGKWKFMYKEYFRDVMTEYEKAMMHQAIKELRRKEFDAKVMSELMKDQVKERTFGRAMVAKEGASVTYDSSWK